MATGTTANGRRSAMNGRRRPKRGEPAWDIARIFPMQGEWSEEEYLALERNNGNWMVELVNGFLEVLPMPVPSHQRIVKHIEHLLSAFVAEYAVGEVLTAPMPIRLWARQMREPDIGYFRPGRIPDPEAPPQGADLVMEVPSPGDENRERDLVEKRRDYARARIPEYWIIDPEKETITVLTLSGKSYKVHGKFEPGERATSKLLPGFSLVVAAVFAAGKGKS